MTVDSLSAAQIVANLDAWLDTLRIELPARSGYGGPVVHWWQNCLAYSGAGLDWRYEGIISGYLTLWRRTGEQRWIEKAQRAGDDLVAGQLNNGNFRASCFEQNPYAGGTPHEAAADLGLLRLANALRETATGSWERYATTAEKNFCDYYLRRMWDEDAELFRDKPDVPSLVPNKACTLVEAIFEQASLQGNAEPIERYALPTLRAVIAMQINTPGPLSGAIPQNRICNTVVEAYFPYYIARCIPALLQAHNYTGEQQWLDAAASAADFLVRHIGEDGLLPQAVYTHGINRYPQWIAPLGDVLRVFNLLHAYGYVADTALSQQALFDGMLTSGGCATARGFDKQINQGKSHNPLPDFRDQISVAGWVDKAFAYLAAQVPEQRPLPQPQVGDFEVTCHVRGTRVIWYETAHAMTLTHNLQPLYLWRKGEPMATIVAPELMWK